MEKLGNYKIPFTLLTKGTIFVVKESNEKL